MPEEITSKNCADLKVLLATFKADLEHIKTCVERLASAIEKLNVESSEYKTKMKFVTEDIHELKTYTDNVKAINESNKVVDYINNHCRNKEKGYER